MVAKPKKYPINQQRSWALIIDKLTFTCEIPRTRLTEMQERLSGHPQYERAPHLRSHYKASGFLYARPRNGLETKADDPKILIQSEPQASGLRNTRITVNPSRFKKTDRQQVYALFRELFGRDLEMLFARSKVTGLDVALDVQGVQIEDVFFSVRPQRQRMVYYRDDLAQSVYYGDGVVVYDKTAERAVRGIVVDHALTRIELRHKNLGCSIKELLAKGEALIRRFRNIRAYRVSELAAQKRIPASFIDSCHWRGIDGALRRLNAGDRDVIAGLIKNSRVHLYDYTDLAESLARAIKRLWQMLTAA